MDTCSHVCGIVIVHEMGLVLHSSTSTHSRRIALNVNINLRDNIKITGGEWFRFLSRETICASMLDLSYTGSLTNCIRVSVARCIYYKRVFTFTLATFIIYACMCVFTFTLATFIIYACMWVLDVSRATGIRPWKLIVNTVANIQFYIKV